MATKEIQLDPGIWSKTSRIQLLYGTWVTMSHVAIGLCLGFAAVVIPELMSSTSEIPITRNDASWIVSILLLLSPIGCMASGFIMDRFGRRIMIIFSQVAMFIGWLYTSLAKSPLHIIIARAIIGVGCGMALSPPRVYCTEISLPNIRGVLGAFPNVAQSLGMAVQAALGKFLSWKQICYVCCIFTLVNSCSYTLLPESPYFILQTKTIADARTNLSKFRSAHYDIDREMDQLIDFKQYNNIRKLTFKENMTELFNKASCKPFWLITIYLLIGQFAGNSAIMFWPVELLTDANSSIDVYVGNILVNVTRVFMAIITSILLYRVGRRPMALFSALGVAVVCFILGVFLLYYDDPSVLPLICFILYNIFASLGYFTLPHLMAFELFPLQVRGILGGVLVSIHSLLLFASTYVEPIIVDYLGVDYMFLSFGGFSVVGTAYLYFCLPETRNLTLQEIEEYYKDIRPTLVSQRRLMTLNASAMQISPKAESTLFKPNRDDLLASRTSMLAQLDAKRQLAMLEREKSRTDSNKSTKSSDSKKTVNGRKSTDTIYVEKKDEDIDAERIKRTTSTVSKESRTDEKSKELKESSKDGERTPKDQASTSKENTQ